MNTWNACGVPCFDTQPLKEQPQTSWCYFIQLQFLTTTALVIGIFSSAQLHTLVYLIFSFIMIISIIYVTRDWSDFLGCILSLGTDFGSSFTFVSSVWDMRLSCVLMFDLTHASLWLLCLSKSCFTWLF